MLLYRRKMRTEVIEINNQDALKPMERISYGLRIAYSERESVKLRKEQEQEKEFIRNSEMIKKYVVYLKAKCNEVFNEYKGGTMLVLVDREAEDVLPQIIKNKNLRGYEIKIGYVDEVALKTKKNIRIPIYITDLTS